MRPNQALANLLFLLGSFPGARASGPHNVLVLVNDRSEDSKKVAAHYAEARKLHPRNLCHLETSSDLEIPYAQYEEEIRAPLLRYLRRSALAGQIDYLVATQGFPLRLRLPPGSRQETLSLCAALAALDTDLDLLPAGRLGRPNPLFGEPRAFSHELDLRRPGLHIYLSTMLAAATADDAIALIDSAIQAESTTAPRGLFLFQYAGSQASGRNQEYPRIAQALGALDLRARRLNAQATPEELADLPPLIAWFAGGSTSGLGREEVRRVRFQPGAIADMLEPLGAAPERFGPESTSAGFSAAWLLEGGASFVHASVAETPLLAFPAARAALAYARGFNAAESMACCISTFWWQNALFGDPLLAPYAHRPTFDAGLEALLPGPVGGTLRIHPSGIALARCELLVDGLRATRAPAGEPLVWSTLGRPDGLVRLTVVAIGAGPPATQARAEAEVAIFNPSFRVLGMHIEGDKHAMGPLDGLRIALSRRPALPVPPGAIEIRAAGDQAIDCDILPGSSPDELRLVPLRPLPASTSIEIRAGELLRDSGGRALESPVRELFRTIPARLLLSGPAEIPAGSPAAFQVSSYAGDGSDAPPDETFEATLEVRSSDPLAEMLGAVALRAGAARFELTPRSAGACEVSVRDPESGLSARATLRVLPGAFDHLAIVAPREHPGGHALEITLEGRDRFDSPTPAPSPEITVAIAGGAGATSALRPADRGRRTLLLPCPWRAGETAIVARVGTREVGRASLSLTRSGIARWLRLGPFDARRGAAVRLPDPPRRPPEAGDPLAGRIWIPGQAPKSPAELAWLRENRSCWLAFPLVAARRVAARLRLGLAGLDATLYLDGRELTAGLGAETFVPAAILKKINLRPGWHWIGLALAKTQPGAPAFALDLQSLENETPPAGLCIYPLNPLERPARFTLSGHLRVGGHGLAGFKAALEGKGGRRSATSDARGLLVFPRVPPGSYRLRPLLKGHPCKPPQRQILVEDRNLWSLDFAVEDTSPPAIKILDPRPGSSARRLLRVKLRVTDDLGVAYVSFALDGKAVGSRDYSPPYGAEIPLPRRARGRHVLGVLARDHAGNESEAKVAFNAR